MALDLFKATTKSVPAYGDFLKKNKVDPLKIKTIEDFKNVPVITKDNYLKAYPLNELLPKGNTNNIKMISTSSGSSGISFFWPRTDENQNEASLIHELFLTEFFQIHKKRTLFINTFAMGMWVAGTTTFESISLISKKYDMTMVTPGIDIEQILKSVEHVGGYYEQIVLAGYPPFIKDVLQAGRERGIAWKKHSVRLLFAAESFSEDWRDSIHDLAGMSKLPNTGSINIYGTADALILAHETPLTILLRRLITKKPMLHDLFFGHERRIPTLAQYFPHAKYFEELPESKIIFSSASGIPLVRYDIGDTGNILSIEDMKAEFAEHGVDMKKEIQAAGLSKHVWNLPLVSIYGRDRMTASLYGLKIYPEHVSGALEGKSSDSLTTGRFLMTTKNDKKNDQYLEINIELNPKIKNTVRIKNFLQKEVQKRLLRVNSEYNKLHQTLGARVMPVLILHPHNTSELFSRNGKQRWKV